MMDDLAENMKESRTANETIVSSAQNTSEDCMKSLSHVSSMHDIVAEMVQASASIFFGSLESIRPKKSSRHVGFFTTWHRVVCRLR